MGIYPRRRRRRLRRRQIMLLLLLTMMMMMRLLVQLLLLLLLPVPPTAAAECLPPIATTEPNNPTDPVNPKVSSQRTALTYTPRTAAALAVRSCSLRGGTPRGDSPGQGGQSQSGVIDRVCGGGDATRHESQLSRLGYLR